MSNWRRQAISLNWSSGLPAPRTAKSSAVGNPPNRVTSELPVTRNRLEATGEQFPRSGLITASSALRDEWFCLYPGTRA